MKLKKIFTTSRSSKEILGKINKAHEVYLKRHQGKATINLLLSAEGEREMMSFSLVSRYEEEQQKEIDRMTVIIDELSYE